MRFRSLKTRIQRLECQIQTRDMETPADRKLRLRLQAARERVSRIRREAEALREEEKAA